jgi:hypothetical protein
MPQTNVKGSWPWGCPPGISVDAVPEPDAGCPVTETVSSLRAPPQGPAPMFSLENWYFAK